MDRDLARDPRDDARRSGFDTSELARRDAEDSMRAGRKVAAEREATRARIRDEGRARREAWKQRGARDSHAWRDDASRSEYRRGRRSGRSRDGARRAEQLLRDVAVWRTVAYRDLVDRHFDGHHYAGRRAIDRLVSEGLLEVGRGRGPRGGGFLTVTATPRGKALVDKRLKAAGAEGLRTWHGRAKRREMAHDCAAYRATMLAADRIREQGGTVVRIRTEAELKSLLARASERARVREGKAAADRARLAEAERLGLPVRNGKVLVPDAQIEYTEGGGPDVAKVQIEVTTGSYSASQVAAKAQAGFTLTAIGMGARAGRALDLALARGLAGGGGGGGGGGRKGKGRDASTELDF